VQTPRGIVSLVFEAEVREGDRAGDGSRAPQIVGKPDVYIIDGDGVRLVRRRRRVLSAVLAGAAIFLLLWAISRLLRRSK
jgi:hypothetical protein